MKALAVFGLTRRANELPFSLVCGFSSPGVALSLSSLFTQLPRGSLPLCWSLLPGLAVPSSVSSLTGHHLTIHLPPV